MVALLIRPTHLVPLLQLQAGHMEVSSLVQSGHKLHTPTDNGDLSYFLIHRRHHQVMGSQTGQKSFASEVLVANGHIFSYYTSSTFMFYLIQFNLSIIRTKRIQSCAQKYNWIYHCDILLYYHSKVGMLIIFQSSFDYIETKQDVIWRIKNIFHFCTETYIYIYIYLLMK